VKAELYETSSPPGKRGGAVSGAGPCPLADGTQSAANDSNAKYPHGLRNDFFDFKTCPPTCSTRMRQPGADSEARYAEAGEWVG